MFESSQSTEKLDAALARIQGEMKPAIKDSANPFYNSRYADLAAVWEVARTVLSKHGVNVTQWPVSSLDGRITLVTRIALGGEWMRATFSIPVVKQDPQGFGSATTYIRRFALMAALGIAPVDDDGSASSGKFTPSSHPVKEPATAPHSPQDVKSTSAPAPSKPVIKPARWVPPGEKIQPTTNVDAFDGIGFGEI